MAALLTAPPASGISQRDFEAYDAGGAAWNAGADPYSRAIWTAERAIPGVVWTRDELLPFVSPPWTLWLFGALARLPYPLAALLWRVVVLASAIALAIASLRLSGTAVRGEIAATAIFAASFAPIENAFALGQLTLIASAAAALAMLARGPATAGPAAAIATAQPAAAIPLLALAGSARGIAALIVAAALTAAAVALSGTGAQALAYASTLSAHAAAESCTAFQITIGALACAAGAPAWFGAAWLVLGIAASLAIVSARRRDAVSAFIALCALTPLWVPFAHEHALSAVLVPAIASLRRASGGWWIAGAAGSLLVATDWIGLWTRPGAVAETAALALAAVLAALALAPELQPRRFLLLALPLFVAAIGSYAALHPIGEWPENLPPAFHTGASSAAAAWRRELVATGLTASNGGAVIPRALSLSGCALLLAVSLRRATAAR